MRFASVCSGIGAPELAWARLGWSPAWCSEIEPFASAVLAERFGVANVGDMAKIDPKAVTHDHGPINILVGGTPCQSFSLAGLRAGLDDDRGNLARRFVELARDLRPEWVVWENVPGVLSSNGGRDFGAIVGALAKCGYGWAYRILDAQFFRVAQRRRRVFLVGHLGDERRAAAVLLERAGLRGDSAPSREAGARVAGCLSPGAKPGGINGQDAYSGNIVTVQGQAGAEISGDVCPTMSCNHEAPIAFDTTQVTSRENRSNPKPGDPCHPLTHGGKAPAIAFSKASHPLGSVELAEPVTTRNGDGGCVMHNAAVRRLTPRECERLQRFPDDWTLIDYRGKPASDAPRYRAIGNSMAVPVMEWLGRRIAMVNSVDRGAPIQAARPIAFIL
jgi:DNA (cytosine-5)-methyltransferase 1